MARLRPSESDLRTSFLSPWASTPRDLTWSTTAGWRERARTTWLDPNALKCDIGEPSTPVVVLGTVEELPDRLVLWVRGQDIHKGEENEKDDQDDTGGGCDAAVRFFAQTPQVSKSPVSDAVRSILDRQSKSMVAAADEMPAEKYSFHPTPAQMTFGHLVVHMADSNNFLCSKISGMPAPSRRQTCGNRPEGQAGRRAESFVRLLHAGARESGRLKSRRAVDSVRHANRDAAPLR